MNEPIYLDYNATTPVDARVVNAMLPYLSGDFGNASSAHAYGRRAHDALEKARGQVAGLLGASPNEIVFTGGGSESDNLAIKGVVLRRVGGPVHVITSSVDHPAVLATLAYLADRFGVEVTLLDTDGEGRVSPEAVAGAIRPHTALVTIMHANNEVGTLQPITEISRMTRQAGILLHVDAAQSVGKVPVNVEEMGVDMLTVAGHKLYAPKGIGALYIRRTVELDPLIHGATQEGGRRAGTENVASIAALGAAAELAGTDLPTETGRLQHLRDRLYALLADAIPGLERNGHPTQSLPNTLNVSFPGVAGYDVLAATPGVAASTGSACHSGVAQPSGVLLAMGHPAERALGAVRLSLGRFTTDGEIDRAAALLAEGYKSLQSSAVLGATR